MTQTSPAARPDPPAARPATVVQDAGPRDGAAFAPEGVTFYAVSPKLATVRVLVTLLWTVPLLLALIALAIFVGSPWLWIAPAVVVLVLVWLLWLIPRQVRAMGYAEAAEDLLERNGILFRRLVIVPYGRMQHVDVHAGPLDRRFGIAKVQLHTAAATSDVTISGLPTAEASRLRDSLTARGEARLAGL